jgi:hypothetical protein
MLMTTKKITVSSATGVTAYEIAGYVLKENNLSSVSEQFKLVIEEWIVKNNNNDYRYHIGSETEVPYGRREIAEYANDTFCACDDGVSGTSCQCGWRLTADGWLVRGETGWLTDENGLFILKDGRRLNGGHAECTEDLKIGSEEIWSGLDDILGTSSEKLNKDVGSYNTVKLIRDYGENMLAVVFQAFQINIGYTLTIPSRMWIPCKWNTPSEGAYFKVIGRDETDIPIIATRIGNASAPKKLVIAGPHGDERNAQRLIMTSQKYFIQNGAPLDTVLYFIPCLSPTMAFADARGIPNKFWEGGNPNAVMTNGPFQLKTLNIPTLHDEVTFQMREDIRLRNGSPRSPRHGVDANRDFYLSLPSSRAFLSFIGNTLIRTMSNSPQTTTETIIEGRPFTNTTYDNIRVFMMHGYDGSGAVYGPYSVYEKGINERWPARMSAEDIDHVNILMRSYLGIWDFNRRRTDPLYSDTSADARGYQGEWSLHLYKRKIWSMDIELPDYHAENKNRNPDTPSYNEGVRGATDVSLIYDTRLIESSTLPYFYEEDKKNGFYKLLSEYPWR